MTAVQTPYKAQDAPRTAPEAAGVPDYAGNSQAAMLAEMQTAAPRRWLWTREKYYLAAEVGIFGLEERLELIEGEVFYKVSPQSTPHAVSIGRSGRIMRQVFGEEDFRISEEKPIVLDDLTEPEPDIVVARGGWEQQANIHPTPADIVLLIEVSVSTVRFDQTLKAEVYARAGIADYWLLNIPAHQLEVRRDPGLLDSGEASYRSLQIIPYDGQVSPLVMPDAVIYVAAMLPRRQQD